MKKNLGVVLIIAAAIGISIVGCSKASNTQGTKESVATGSNTAGSNGKESTGSNASNTSGSSGVEAGNTSVGDTSEDGSAQAATEEEITLMDKFWELFQKTDKLEDLYQFIDENIDKTTTQDADEMITGLYGLAQSARDVDYNRLAKHSNRYSLEIQQFIDLMKKEQSSPSVTNGQSGLSVGQLLNNALAFENYINTYPQGQLLDRASELYIEILSAAITGGFSYTDDVQNRFSEGARVSQVAIDEYNKVIGNSPGSKTAAVLQEYIGLLGQNNNEITEAVEEYYDGIYEKIEEKIV